MNRFEVSLLLCILDQLQEVPVIVWSVARVRQCVITRHMEPVNSLECLALHMKHSQHESLAV